MKVVKYNFIYRFFSVSSFIYLALNSLGHIDNCTELFSHYIVVPELLGLSLLRITKDMRLC